MVNDLSKETRQKIKVLGEQNGERYIFNLSTLMAKHSSYHHILYSSPPVP